MRIPPLQTLDLRLVYRLPRPPLQLMKDYLREVWSGPIIDFYVRALETRNDQGYNEEEWAMTTSAH